MFSGNLLSKFGKLIILLIAISFTVKSNAQSSGLGTWNILNFKYNQSPSVSFFAELQLRSLQWYNQFHYYEYKGGINYSVNKSIKLTIGAGSYQTFDEGGNFKTPKMNDEFRLWPQIILLQKFKNATIEQRYRSEMRWTIKGYRNRFRYRFGISYPFGNEKKGYSPFLASFSNELFFTDKEPYFERNRIQLALNRKLSKFTSIQMGYLHQFDYKLNDETGRDFFVLGLYIEWQKKSQTNSEPESGIRDN